MPDHEVKEDEPGELDAVPIDRARDTLGDLVIRAGIKEERIVITRHGRPAAVLVPLRDLERLRVLDAAEAA